MTDPVARDILDEEAFFDEPDVQLVITSVAWLP